VIWLGDADAGARAGPKICSSQGVPPMTAHFQALQVKLWGNNQHDFKSPRKQASGVSRPLLPTRLFAPSANVRLSSRLVLVLISVNSIQGQTCQHEGGALLHRVYDVRYWRNTLARSRLKGWIVQWWFCSCSCSCSGVTLHRNPEAGRVATRSLVGAVTAW